MQVHQAVQVQEQVQDLLSSDSKEVGAKVIYQGREMIVSKGEDNDSAI